MLAPVESPLNKDTKRFTRGRQTPTAAKAFSPQNFPTTIWSAALNAICNKYGFYTQTVIPGGTYKGTDDDTPALAIKATLAVSSKLDEETVYQMTKALFENLDELSRGHAKGKEVSAESAVKGASVPFHAGAKKYYKEIGLNVN